MLYGPGGALFYPGVPYPAYLSPLTTVYLTSCQPLNPVSRAKPEENTRASLQTLYVTRAVGHSDSMPERSPAH